MAVVSSFPLLDLPHKNLIGPAYNKDIILEGIPWEFASAEQKYELYYSNLHTEVFEDISLGSGIKGTVGFDYWIEGEAGLMDVFVYV